MGERVLKNTPTPLIEQSFKFIAHGHIFEILRYTTKKWLVVVEGLLGVELRHLHQLTHSSASPTRKLSTKLTMLACLISFITKISLMMSSCENGEYSNQCPPLECSQRIPHPHTVSCELIAQFTQFL